ncbi:sugar phosphate isomerase/epimerase family protein [Flavihumibacter petaseus]|uniref:Putative sugar dehydratase n=1 Tax=Flavihumibacter petaseus NBRC 106054 TaxID=1220578 RepID=A0A0E9N4A3_9BACT|nr:sugar phosphate isomerase/epimerase [Flavihumibacter petaseus]GAO44195.1 putative sugar dehydratase [Flavihumibacter petaseus NBRC 106054]
MTTRRSFLRNSALVGSAALLLPDLLLANKKNAAVGIQLYTLRDLVSKDGAKPVLDQIAAAGYKKVELYGYGDGKFFGMPVSEFAAYLHGKGLVSPSGHYAPAKWLAGNGDEGREELDSQIQACLTMKHEFFTIPWLNQELRNDLDGYKRLVGRINSAAEIVKKAGLKLAYHNHDFEFKSYDGVTGYDIMTKECDPNLVQWELDLYWVVFAGLDPVALIEKLKGRAPMWHVKDMDKVNRSQNTEVGNGSVDFKRIFSAAKTAGLKHFFVEQENNYVPDPIGSINSSIKYIKANLV